MNVHIRLQQRNGSKYWTLIEGLSKDIDVKKVMGYLRKCLQTGGAVVQDKDGRQVIQLQGDCAKKVEEFLLRYDICDKSLVRNHAWT